MNFDFVEELQWRGMCHDVMPGTQELLNKEMVSGYVGFDPTSDSLHIGNLVSIILLKRLQLAGHKPFALVGGATGMIGDPSGKSAERNLLSEETLRYNEFCIKKQLEQFLDFNSGANSAEMVNNYDWFKDFNFLSFLREVGKFLTVNYMMSKDSVQKRLETGLSFTEFSYQLVQGYDFFWLNQNKNCKLQMGGSDQWGNIVTGTELIRRKADGEAYALTSPLITKADGSKFGKSESGNIWLDRNKTSPYSFYQFWINVADDDAEKFIKIFTFLSKTEIETLIEDHRNNLGSRVLQKVLAKEVTVMVHSEEDYNSAIQTTEILFGKGSSESLKSLDENSFLSAMDGVPLTTLPKDLLNDNLQILELLTTHSNILPSKAEARKLIQGGGLSINKDKINDANGILFSNQLLNGKFAFVQKGKKNYFLIHFQ